MAGSSGMLPCGLRNGVLVRVPNNRNVRQKEVVAFIGGVGRLLVLMASVVDTDDVNGMMGGGMVTPWILVLLTTAGTVIGRRESAAGAALVIG